MLTTRFMLYNWIGENEHIPRSWREGVLVNPLKKGNKAELENCRGITLLSTLGESTAGEASRKMLNDRLGMMLEKGERSANGKQVLQ